MPRASFRAVHPVLPVKNVGEAISYYVDRLGFTEFEPSGVFHANTAVRDTAWGTREFAFFDPDRNGLTFYRATVER